MPGSRVLRAVTGVNVSGASGVIVPESDVRDIEMMVVDVTLSNLTGGTAPGVTFTIERKDANGVWRVLYAFAALTANGSLSRNIGTGLETNVMVPNAIRVSWATTGGPTTAVGDVSIVGDTHS